MKIIPTPHIFNYTKENSPLTVFSSIVIDREMDETICWGINELKKKFSVPCENGSTLTLVHSDNVFFQDKNASEQGYILTRKGNNIVLEAQTSIGFMYGLMTLLQFYGDAPE